MLEEYCFKSVEMGHEMDSEYFGGLLQLFFEHKNPVLDDYLIPFEDPGATDGNIEAPTPLMRICTKSLFGGGAQRTPKLLRIFIQGEGNEQNLPLTNAVKRLIAEFNVCDLPLMVEWMSNKSMRDRSWDKPDYLINWLLMSTCHVIASQGLHMGTFNNPGFDWDISETYEQVKR